jgi:hypothetical protein
MYSKIVIYHSQTDLKLPMSTEKSLNAKLNEMEFKVNELANRLKNSPISQEVFGQLKRSLFKSMEYRYKDRPIHNSKAMNIALKYLSQSLGLDLISDEELNPDMMTICGSIFVIDIVNTETDINVTITATNDVQVPPALNEYLTNLLKEANLFAFEEATQLIAFIDKFASDPKVDLFRYLSQFEEDMKYIYQTEHAFLGSVQTVIQSGHGYPTFYEQSIGPSITYFANSQVLYDFENCGQELDEGNSFMAKVVLISSKEPVLFLPQSLLKSCLDPTLMAIDQDVMVTQQAMQILGSVIQVYMPSSSCQSLNAAFALKLVPQIDVTKEIERRILESHAPNHAQKDFNDYNDYTGETFETKFVTISKLA